MFKRNSYRIDQKIRKQIEQVVIFKDLALVGIFLLKNGWNLIEQEF